MVLGVIMNILILSTVPYKKNGISMVIQSLYVNDVFSKENITFVFPNGCDSVMVEQLIGCGYEVIINEERIKHPIRYVRFLIQIMKNKKIDILHVHGSSATNAVELFAGFFAKIPIRIMHSHSNKNKYVMIHKVLKPFLNHFCNARFACSQSAGKFVFGKKSFLVINNAFEVGKYKFNEEQRKAQRELLNIHENTLVIGHVGEMTESKNQTFLLDVFKICHDKSPNSKLLLIGDGKTKEMVERHAHELEVQEDVIFLGSRDDVFKLLNAMDCFVFPSLHEGLGIAPIEAQANGLAVVSACDNIPQDIRINNNFLFISLSAGASDWATSILKIDKTRDLNGNNSVSLAGFDIEKEKRRLYDLYIDLLKKRTMNSCK